MSVYNNVFGGTVVYPANVTFRAVTLNASTELSWPTELATDGDVVAQIMNVTAAAGPFDLTMPPADQTAPGQTTLIFNVGANDFVVTDNAGNTIVSIAPGLAYQIFLTDNTTVAGVWGQVQYGAGTSQATAGSLAGPGIKALGTALAQSMSVAEINLDYAFGVAADRSTAFVWTGGAGTLTLPLASDAGNDWFVQVRNNGTGAITIAPSGSDLINGDVNAIFNPNDSAIIVCSGTGWYTIGLGQAADFAFDYASIDLSTESTPYTLVGANLNRIAYSFSGAIGSAFDIIVPMTTQQYWVTNNTSGGYTITVKTASGTGVTVAAGAAAILYCNGTDVVEADTGGVAYPISVANGGTGATNATNARTNLSAAKSGVNSDITQLASLSDGGASSPALTFLSESNTGIYRSGAGALSVALAGAQTATFGSNGLNLVTGDYYSINGSSVLNATTLGTGVTASSLTSVGTLTAGELGAGFTTVAVARGGTGVTTVPTNGQIMIGNGTGYTVASLTAGTGISITPGAGSITITSTGALTNWTEAVNTAAPNATIPVVSFTATNAASSVDAALVSKGTGAILAQVPDGTSTAGNKRGSNAVDWQMARTLATHVASGARSVLSGGSGNTAGGADSVVSGGASNTASGQYSSIAGGVFNTASGNGATVAGGSTNTASGNRSFSGGGFSNTASGSWSATAGGYSNTASGDYAATIGGAYITTRGIEGVVAEGSGDSPIATAVGVSQRRRFVLGRQTTGTTPTVLATNSSAAGATNQIILPNNSAFYFRGEVISNVTGAGNTKGWFIEGVIKRGASAASTALVGSATITSNYADAGAASWSVAVTADTTNGGLAITVTGQAATTIRWVADVKTTEVTF